MTLLCCFPWIFMWNQSFALICFVFLNFLPNWSEFHVRLHRLYQKNWLKNAAFLFSMRKRHFALRGPRLGRPDSGSFLVTRFCLSWIFLWNQSVTLIFFVFLNFLSNWSAFHVELHQLEQKNWLKKAAFLISMRKRHFALQGPRLGGKVPDYPACPKWGPVGCGGGEVVKPRAVEFLK